MEPMRGRPAVLHAGLAVALAAALVAQGPPADDVQEIADTVNDARATQHLPPLRLDPDLTRAAQAQADAMTRGRYFALQGPDGRGIDELVAETSYAAALLSEKLVRSSKQPAMLGLQWSLAPGEQSASLFHPEVSDLGVGLGSLEDDRLYVLVVARSSVPSASAGAAGLADLGAARASYLELVGRDREQRRLPALRSSPVLERAAQAHAEALLAARLAGQPTSAVASLAERVERERGVAAQTGVGGAGSCGICNPTRNERELYGAADAVGASVVTDAASGEAAARMALAAAGSALGEASYRSVGIGMAWRLEGNTLHSVWVACLSPRAER